MADALTGTTNFTPGEYERVSTGGRVPAAYRANAQETLEALQRVRDVLGVPVIITNGYRSKAANEALRSGGAATNSQHLTASAADFDVPSMTKREVAEALDDNQDFLQPYGQLIYYLTDDHYHIGIGTKAQQLVKVDSSAHPYVPYAGADTMPDAHTPAGSGPWKLLASIIGVLILSRLVTA